MSSKDLPDILDTLGAIMKGDPLPQNDLTRKFGNGNFTRKAEENPDDHRSKKKSDDIVTRAEDGMVNGSCCDNRFTIDGSGGSNSDGRNFRGRLLALEKDWGIVAVGERAYNFLSNDVYLFGLRVGQLPLSEIFHPDQIVSVCVEEEKVTSLIFGSSLTSPLRDEAISLYCVSESISDNIRDSLEELSRQQQ